MGAPEPVESVIVGDKRPTFGKRLGIFALILLVLFFAINGYIQSAKNGRELKKAQKAQEDLIEDVHDLSEVGVSLVRNNVQLQEALRKQNQILKDAGFATVIIPRGEMPPSESERFNQQDRSNQPNEQNKSNRPNRPNKPNRPDPPNEPPDQPGPPEEPDPPGDILDDVQEQACELTGICLFGLIFQ